MENTIKRIDDILAELDSVKAKGRLDQATAAALAGRLTFAGAQCIGRTGAAFLAPIRRVSRSPGGAALVLRLAAALAWWRVFLVNGVPRKVRFLKPESPAVLFVDGACEENFCGVGALLVDRVSGRCEAFGFKVPAFLVEALCAATGSRQIIAQLELLPVLVSIWLWSSAFSPPGRRALIFIDNESARFAMIRGYSPVAASRSTVESSWAELARLQAAPWFERVPSAGNPADAPSRCDRERLSVEVPGVTWVSRPFEEARLRELAASLGERSAR